MGALTQTVAPASEPLTTAEAKAHLRIDDSADDGYIGNLITAAREYAESYTRRQFIDATYTWKLDSFPHCDEMELPVSPISSVTSITYTDSAGNTGQTLSSSIYDVDTDSETPRITLDPAENWPSTEAGRAHVVTVTFVAGYGSSASDVPESIRQAMLILIGHWYENREAVVVGSNATRVPMAVESLLDIEKYAALY